MKFLAPAVVLFALGWSYSPNRQDEESALEQFRAFRTLVGTTWVGTFPDGKLTDTHEFEWVFGGKFLRNRLAVATAEGDVVYEGETIYGWDADRESLLWWYFNSTGGYVTGTAEVEGNRVVAEGENSGRGDQVERVRSVFVIEEDAWRSISYFPDGEGWKERFDIEFRPKQ